MRAPIAYNMTEVSRMHLASAEPVEGYPIETI